MFARRSLRGRSRFCKKMVLYGTAIIIIALFVSGCGDDGPSDPGSSASTKGSIDVSVQDQFGFGIHNVEVTTNPETSRGMTNIIGKCRIDNIAPGSYRVIANLTGIGGGSNDVIVQSAKVSDVVVVLVPGTFLEPAIQLLSPAPPAEFTPGDLISFQARVSDLETNVSDLTVEWSSDVDRVLNTDPPGADSLVSFSTSTLSRAVHWIRLKVTDTDARVAVDSIEVANVLPAAVTLSTLQKSNNTLTLQWTQSLDAAFYSYEIYRAPTAQGTGTLISTITDVATTTYEDDDITLGETYWYWVRVVNTEGYGNDSNK